jgi:hypothetical protein
MITISLAQRREEGDLLAILGAKRLPGLVGALQSASNFAQNEWVKAVERSSAKDGWKRHYANAIGINFKPKDLEATVQAEGMYPRLVEQGVARRDMKPDLLQGEDYRVIPMRKMTPKAQASPKSRMTQAQYNAVRKLQPYRVIGIKGPKVLASGRTVMQKQYSPSKGTSAGGITKTGSGYVSFRIVTKDSPGWFYPHVPAVPVFVKLVERIRPQIDDILRKGYLQDIEAGIAHLHAQENKAK